MPVGWCWSDCDVGAQLFEFCFGNSFDCEQVFYALEWAAAISEIDDGFRGVWTDAGESFELSDCGGVYVDRLSGGSFLGEGDFEAKKKNGGGDERDDFDSVPENGHDKRRDASWLRTAGGRAGTACRAPTERRCLLLLVAIGCVFGYWAE